MVLMKDGLLFSTSLVSRPILIAIIVYRSVHVFVYNVMCLFIFVLVFFLFDIVLCHLKL